ncbi:MAG: P-loop NTPase [Anaerolineae bacterium]|nr:P-loop NTPase [Anaerolineae bacterium]
MELTAYIRLVRRWLWLIALAAVVAGSIAFATARTQPARYRATTTIQIGTYIDLTDPNPMMIQSAAALAQTYVALLKTSSIMNNVIQNLQLPFSPQGLAGLFDGKLMEGTSLLTLTVNYTDPVMAADIANELARQLILNSPNDLTDEQRQQLNILQDEILRARDQLQAARDEMATIDARLSATAEAPVSEDERVILTARRSELMTLVNETQNNLALMTGTVNNMQQRGTINYLKVVEPAAIPTAAIGTSPLSQTLVAAAVGAVLALGVAFLIEYLNDSIRSPAEIMPLLNVPLFGAIAPFGNKRNYKNRLITWTSPRSTIAEAYRAVRVNILFRETKEEGQETGEEKAPRHIYVITSPGPSEGKSITAANMAVTFAMTGMRVLLIDADLRRPTQHQIFNVPNTTGLSNIWSKEDLLPPPSVMRGGNGQSNGGGNGSTAQIVRSVQQHLNQIVQHTEIPGLDVIPAGPIPPNPAELLDTPQMHELMRQVIDSLGYNVVLFDTPPVLVVTDGSVIGSVAKAKAILVVESGRTHRGAAVRAVQQLITLSIPVLGVVMNRLKAQDRDANYGYYYYYYGYTRYGDDRSPRIGPGIDPRQN